MNKIRNIVVVLALVLTSACFASDAQKSDSPRKVTLIIWAGQSNAQGWQGDAADYPADPDGLDKQIPFFYLSPGIGSSGGKWITLSKQAGRFRAGHFGPEITFARQLKKQGTDVAIFKCTLGSTSIVKNWKLPGQKGLYDGMLVHLKNAVKLLQDQGIEVTYGGFVWIQGESDAQNPGIAKGYKARLVALIKHLRETVTKRPDLPVLLGLDEQHPWVKKNPEVITAQEELARELPACVRTSMLGLPKADTTHLTPAGLLQHGKTLADAYSTLVKAAVTNSRKPIEGK